MAENEKFNVGTCPNCSARIVYNDGDKGVYCTVCDEYVSVEDLKKHAAPSGGEGGTNTANIMALMAGLQSFGDADSSLAYVDSFFKTFDWEVFLNSTDLGIKDLEEIATDAKKKHANDGKTWLLEFNIIEMPLAKKTEY